MKEFEPSSHLDYKNCLRICPSTFGEVLELFTPLVQRENTNMREVISPKQVTWYNSSQTCPYTLQTVAQTVKPHQTRSVCATACVAQTVWPCVGSFRLSLAVIKARFFVQPLL